MKKLFQNTVMSAGKLDSQTLRSLVFVGTLILFSLIAGAPFAGGGSGG